MGDASAVQSIPAFNNPYHEHDAIVAKGDGRGVKARSSAAGAPFYSQLDSIHAPEGHTRTLANMQHAQHRLDMSVLGGALPDVGGPQSQRNFHQHPGSVPTHDIAPYPQYGQPAQSPAQFRYPYQQQGSTASPLARGAGHAGVPQQHVQYSPFAPYNTPYGAPFSMMHQAQAMSPLVGEFPGSFSRMGNLPQGQPLHYPGMDPRPFIAGQSGPYDTFAGQPFGDPAFAQRASTVGPTPSYPRGPPRKPKQSGHALWVGNLPPGTSVLDLKDHFSREATQDIESLFLISKSNCAFVNYRTETACASAMGRFHDSRFNGVRLVCRLRRGSVSTTNVPSAQAPAPALAPTLTRLSPTSPMKRGEGKNDSEPPIACSDNTTSQTETVDGPEGATIVMTTDAHVPDKYFIVKSLTMQDLEASVSNGVWATQSHNEEGLNKAFESADNVYLIFSANKSGEYFGYARMTSTISSEAVTANPRAEPESEDVADGPTSIATPATEFAPKGRVIDDSARGTVFWEAELSDAAADGESSSSSFAGTLEQRDGAGESNGEHLAKSQDWGKPFKIQWMSTSRVPFYRTRGLRNPWNSNREVKIARDGTELEPSIGNRLVQMFHRPGGMPPVGIPAAGMPGMMMHMPAPPLF